jgi:ABC-type uncharacterized transport system permease subunit
MTMTMTMTMISNPRDVHVRGTNMGKWQYMTTMITTLLAYESGPQYSKIRLQNDCKHMQPDDGFRAIKSC